MSHAAEDTRAASSSAKVTTPLTADIDEREPVAREIARTRDAIRKKHRALKTGRIEDERALEWQFKPLVEPLHELVERIDATPTERGGYVAGVKRKLFEDVETRPTPLKPKKRRQSRPALAPLPIPLRFADDDAVSTPEPSSASPGVVVVERLSRPSEERETLLQQLGPLGRKYMSVLLNGNRAKLADTTFGVYVGDAGTMLGNKRIDFGTDDTIYVDDQSYVGTPGLYELIFMKRPDKHLYTENDKEVYHALLMATNAHRRDHTPLGQVKSNRGYKYMRVIAPLLSDAAGAGLRSAPSMRLTGNAIDYVHWNDPNELVDRLRLLDASRRAGNDSHANEFLSIIEELREEGLII